MADTLLTADVQETTTQPQYPEMTFRSFLEQTPPDKEVQIIDFELVPSSPNYLAPPEILFFCESPDCEGPRVFRAVDSIFWKGGWNFVFLKYECRNCGKRLAYFSISFRVDKVPTKDAKGHGIVMKLGQIPTFGPQTPPKLLRLIEPDRELFLQGRRAEIRGLGIGAFAYYRRVVENQRKRIIERIAKVSKVVGSTATTDALFVQAMNEIQFSKSIELVKDFMPQALLISGENPLTLLHSALSKGLHNPEMTDSHCLELAQSIRTILVELAERAASVLKEDKEIQDALKVLKAVPRGTKQTPEDESTVSG